MATKENKICVGCGSSFVSNLSRKFCNQKCYHTNQAPWNKGNSAKKTYVCPYCNISFKAYHKAKYCSMKCRDADRPVWNKGLTAKDDKRIAKYAATQTGKPKHTEETKKKLSKYRKGVPNPHTEEWNRKIGVGFKKFYAEHPEYREKLRRRFTGKNHPSYGTKASIETRRKQSRSHALRYQKNPQLANKTYKTGHYHSDKNSVDFWYRSSYEKAAFDLLENMSDVVKYEVESLRIPYEYLGFTHYFIPDILVEYQDMRKVLIEVKPKNRVMEKQNQAKIRGAMNYCKINDITFTVWTEKELGIVI